MIRTEPITSMKNRKALPKDVRDLLDWYCVADELSSRFKQIFKQKEINVAEWSKLHGGGFWYVPAYDRRRYSDGSFDEVPKNRLSEFLSEPTQWYPDRENYRYLEWKLGYQPNQICTVFEKTLGLEGFLYGCDFITADGSATSKYRNSPRVRAYFDRKKEELKDREKRSGEYQRLQAKKKQDDRKAGKDKQSRFRKLAQGMFFNKDEKAPAESIQDLVTGEYDSRDDMVYEEEI